MFITIVNSTFANFCKSTYKIQYHQGMTDASCPKKGDYDNF